MEIRSEGSEFKVYNKGGLNLKILLIDLPAQTVREPVQFRAEQGWKVEELKAAIAEVQCVLLCCWFFISAVLLLAFFSGWFCNDTCIGDLSE